MKAQVVLCGIVGALLPSMAVAADVYGLERGEVSLQSAGRLAFGPDGILFVGDSKAAKVFAIATDDERQDASDVELKIERLQSQLAQTLGTDSQAITVNDLAVHSGSGNVYLSVSTGDGPELVRVTTEGEIEQISLDSVRHASVQLPNPPEDKEFERRGRKQNNRNNAITDLAWVDGQLIVSGLSSSDAPSNVRSIAFPFASASQGASLEIYHAAHGRLEDYGPVQTFVPFVIEGEPHLLAGFVCTPLVKFPLSELQKQEKIRGTTVAELGNRNRPLDAIVYEQDGKQYLLMANSARGVMKISTDNIERQEGITEPVRGGGTAGQEYETIEELEGVVQLDKLNEQQAVVLIEQPSAGLTLQTVELP